MSLQIRAILTAMIVFGYTTVLAQADDKEQIKGSIAALAISVSSGDGSAAKKYVVDEVNNQKLIESAARVAKESREFQKAAVAKFGAAGKNIGDGGSMAKNPPYLPPLDELDQSRVATNGDTATVPSKLTRYGDPATFKREGGVWKLEIEAKSDQALKRAIWAGNIADSLQKLVTEVNNGKFSTPKEAERAYLQQAIEVGNKNRKV